MVLPNRSEPSVLAKLRGMDNVTWVADTGVTSSYASGTTYRKLKTDGTPEYKGAYYDTALSPTLCSVQAKLGTNPNVPDGSPVYGLSLQNSSGSIHQDPTNVAVSHAMRFDDNGQCIIFENGAICGYFRAAYVQTAMIELTSGVVRYYFIYADGSMKLLRTTRSKLTSAPKATIMLYAPDVQVTDVWVMSNAQTTQSFESIGALYNFQDWFNEYALASTAEAIQMADNNPQFTFPNHKKRLRTLQANLNRRELSDRLAFIEFFNYHGTEKEFIFVDNARKDSNGNREEFWARFGSPLSDKMRASCISAAAATIIESYRNDYIPEAI